MNIKDNTINDSSFQKLLHNDNYYKHIFKKTEKVVSVVFYILNNIDHSKKSETHISNIASKAHLVHDHVLRTLEVRLVSSREVLEQFAQALISLDSTLRIALATETITSEVLAVVVNEIDTVLRGLNSYITNDSLASLTSMELTATRSASTRSATQPTLSRAQSGSTQSSPDKVHIPSASDRRERIKTILEAKGEASIKDISEIITDCSEKTLQRELSSMISDNIVKRLGERRWSKYSIF